MSFYSKLPVTVWRKGLEVKPSSRFLCRYTIARRNRTPNHIHQHASPLTAIPWLPAPPNAQSVPATLLYFPAFVSLFTNPRLRKTCTDPLREANAGIDASAAFVLAPDSYMMMTSGFLSPLTSTTFRS